MSPDFQQLGGFRPRVATLLRAAAVVVAAAAIALGVGGGSSLASPAALTATPISWTVVGLDSNASSNASLPHIYPVGARVCNTGTTAATNVSGKWTWGDTTGTNTVDQAFNGPAQNATQTVGTLAGGACQDVYFNVDVKQSGGNSSKTHSQNQNIIFSADGGLTATETKLVYVESLVSQNRNTVKAWAGAGGCNLTFSVCDPAPTHVFVGQQYTFKLYAQTSTAYDELEAFAVWPSFMALNSATAKYGTVTSPGLPTSTSIWADSCTWIGMTSSSSGTCTTSGKAGGSTVVTYKMTPTTAGPSGQVQPMIYDHSGSSFHYNAGYTTALSSVEADWKLSATVVGDGTVTSSPNGYLENGTSTAIACGHSGTRCAVGYPNNTSVTLTAAPGSGQVFSGWSGGGCSGTSLTCTVTMNQSRSVTATFTGQTYYPLTVTKYGSGSVAAGDSSIGCGATCSASYANGTSVTLTATPAANWKFDGWGGDCAASGTSPTCTLSMTRANSATASFSERTYTLTVSATGTGAGDLCSNNSNQTSSGLCSPGSESVFISCGSAASVANYTDTICSGTYPLGQSVTLYPMCNGGSAGTPCPGGSGASTVSFGGYTGGTCSGNATTGCTFTMDQDRAVSANFVLGNSAVPDLTIAKSHSGSFTQGATGKTYTLSVSNVGTGAGYSGKTITVTESPPTGLTVTAMSGTGWICALTTCTQALVSNLAAGASLNPITVTVSVASNASSPLVNAATVSCAAACTNDTSNDAAIDSTTILTPPDLTLTKSHGADFAQGSTGVWTLAVTNSGGQATSGAVTVSDSLPSGFTKNAVSGSGWDCTASTSTVISCTRSDALSAGSSYPAIDVTANVGATAVTATNSASVSGGGETNTGNDSASDPTTVLAHLSIATAGAGSGAVTSDVGGIACGSAGSTCDADFTTGTVVTLSAAADTGSTFTGWSGACTGSSSSCQVTMSQARSVTATFALQTFTLSVSTDGAGAGTVTADVGGISCHANTGTCGATFDYGTVVTLSAVADGGSTFAGWTGGCASSGATCQATMTQNRTVAAQFDVGSHPSLTVAKSHTGDFRQGETGASYRIDVSNAGAASSAGLVTVTDTLPTGLSGTAASGTGWSCGVSGQTVTCTRSDALAVSASYPPITVLVDVASNAAASVTNAATVDGGGCLASPCADTTDPTTIVARYQLAAATSGAGAGTVTSDVGSINCGSSGSTCADTYDDGTVVTLTAAADSGSVFTSWSGACTGSATTCQVTMDQARSVTATFVVQTFTLSVATSGSGFGNATSDVGGIACGSAGSACADDFVTGTVVTLTAAADTGSTFTGWSGACTGSSATCQVTMSQARSVTATFTLQTFTVSVTTSGAGAGTVTSDVGGISCHANAGTCDATFDYGTVVTLSESADAGSTFAGWSGGCAPSGASCVATVTQDRSVTAQFDVGAHPLLVVAKSHTGDFRQGDVGDSYRIDVSNAGSAPSSGLVTVTDTLPTGLSGTGASGTGWSCAISGQTVTCTRSDALGVSASYEPITVVVNVASNAVASVANAASVAGGGCLSSPCANTTDPTTIIARYLLSVATSGAGAGTVTSNVGTIDCGSGGSTCANTYDDGTVVTLTAAADSGSVFSSWSGACSGSSATCQVTMDQARAVTATFVVETFALSVATSGSGAGTVTSDVGSIDCGSGGSTCADTYNTGMVVTLTASADASSDFTGWSGGCTGSSATCQVTMSQARSVTATFALKTFTLTVTTSGTGSGSVTSGVGGISCNGNAGTCSASFTYGAAVTLSETADAGSTFGGWTGGCVVSGGTCSATMTQARSVDARFDVVATPSLTVAKSHTGTFRQGDSGDSYSISVHNAGGAPTSGLVTLTDTAPVGLLPTAASGAGWTCSHSGQTATCTRSDALAAGSSYPTITVLVDVAADAASTLTNTVVVGGGGCGSSPCGTATDPTTITPTGGGGGSGGTATASGTVYDDVDANGSRGDGEPGLAGWRVWIDLNGDGKLGAGETSTQTGTDGTFTLTAVPPGAYQVYADAPGSGWTCSQPIPCSYRVTALAGDRMTGLDFGEWAHAGLRGHEYDDRNRDGQHQAGESPLGGWTIYVDYNGNGRLDPGEPSAVTGPEGSYELAGVAAGVWDVREVGQSGWTCSGPVGCVYRVELAPGAELGDRDFLAWTGARAVGRVWNDLEADTVRDANEPLLRGWVVYADYNGDGRLDEGDISTITDAGGVYSFGVRPGAWTIREVAPVRWVCDFPAPCAHRAGFAAGAAVTGDFGNYRLALLSGVMFDDRNRDGRQQRTEPGLGGFEVYVDYNGNARRDRGEPFDITAPGGAGRSLLSARGVPGHYTITGIEPGTWVVRESRKSGVPCILPARCAYRQTFLADSRIRHRNFATSSTPSGQAVLSVPDGCVAPTFPVTVTGREIRRVELSIGDLHRVLTARGGPHDVVAVRVGSRALNVGAHRVVVRVHFTAGSNTAPKRLVRVIFRCGAPSPAYTG